MDYNADITFEQIDEFEYKVVDNNKDVYFIGELDEALDIYSSWTNGTPPPFELEYFVDWVDGADVEIQIEFDEDED